MRSAYVRHHHLYPGRRQSNHTTRTGLQENHSNSNELRRINGLRHPGIQAAISLGLERERGQPANLTSLAHHGQMEAPKMDHTLARPAPSWPQLLRQTRGFALGEPDLPPRDIDPRTGSRTINTEFASDLLNLTPASPVTRGQTRAPPSRSRTRTTAGMWTAPSRAAWNMRLTIDQADADAIDTVPHGCTPTEMAVLAPTTAETSTATATPTSTPRTARPPTS